MKDTPTVTGKQKVINFVILSLGSFVVGALVLWVSSITKDFPNITIQHPDHTVTELRCRTGSGIIACKHDDLYLTLKR